MPVAAESVLMACAVGLYLVDSALLLYFNEGVVSPKGRDGWIVRFGSTLRLRGRELFIPSPLAPHRPLFRLAWNPEGGGAGDPTWTSRRAALSPLAPLVWGMALAVFVLLPLGLFTRLGDAMLLAAVALLYLSIVAALGWLALARRRLGIAGKRLTALAFEALVCSPLAINLVRKVSAEMPANEDLVAAARRLQAPQDWDRARRQFISRIEEELDAEDESSARASLLRKRRQDLLQAAPPLWTALRHRPASRPRRDRSR